MDHDDAMRMLEAISTAFDGHDLDGIMVHFADDAVFDGPRGATRGVPGSSGRPVREGFAARFAGIPDIRYRRTSTSSTATAALRNGRFPERRPMDSRSKSAVATCGRSATARS